MRAVGQFRTVGQTLTLRTTSGCRTRPLFVRVTVFFVSRYLEASVFKE
ncbi:hypothetical protein [Haladaptatus halobius]|nr:hypothetical protein [Haladaptatus halobius]